MEHKTRKRLSFAIGIITGLGGISIANAADGAGSGIDADWYGARPGGIATVALHVGTSRPLVATTTYADAQQPCAHELAGVRVVSSLSGEPLCLLAVAPDTASFRLPIDAAPGSYSISIEDVNATTVASGAIEIFAA